MLCKMDGCTVVALGVGGWPNLCAQHTSDARAMEIGRTNALMAYDETIGPESRDYPTREDAVAAYAINVIDSCSEENLGSIGRNLAMRTFLARCKTLAMIESEHRAVEAKKAKYLRAQAIKACMEDEGMSRKQATAWVDGGMAGGAR